MGDTSIPCASLLIVSSWSLYAPILTHLVTLIRGESICCEQVVEGRGSAKCILSDLKVSIHI